MIPLRSHLLIPALLLLSACVTSGGPMIGQAGREPTDDELVQDFLTVALREGGNEDNAGQRGYLTRFHGPVRVAVHGAPNELERRRMGDILTQVKAVTGHDIAFAAADEPANYHVHMVGTTDAGWIANEIFDRIPSLQGTLEKVARRDGLAQDTAKGMSRAQGQICMAYHYIGKGRPDLESAHVVIARGMAAARTRLCLAEEMLQVLGLPGDTRKAWPSRFSDDTSLQDPSPYDWLYLRLLYDKGIRAGMTGSQVRPVALRLVRQWRDNGRQLAANPDPLPFDPAKYVPSNELLLEKFMTWALAKESGAQKNSENSYIPPRTTMVKWRSDVKLLMTGTIDEIGSQFFGQAEAISKVTGLRILRTRSAGEHNAHIHREVIWQAKEIYEAYRNGVGAKLRAEALEIARRSIYESKTTYREYQIVKDHGAILNSSRERYYYFLAIRVQQSEPEYCRGVYGVMAGGVLPHLPWKSNSLHYQKCIEEAPMYDLLFLRILYDHRIRTDMTEAEALPVARRILGELRPDEASPPVMERLIHPAWRARQGQLTSDLKHPIYVTRYTPVTN